MAEPDDTITALTSRDGPIEAHIHALATKDRLPVRAVNMCLQRLNEAAPILRAAIEKPLVATDLSDDEYTLFLRSLFILGGGRDTESCRLFYRLVGRPSHVVEALLGDIITEDLPRLLAGVFDGDSTALFDLIDDRSTDEFVRSAAQGAATFLTAQGRIDRADMCAALRRFWEARAGEPSDYIWVSWLEAIGLLGLRELTPLVDRAFDDKLIDPKLIDRSGFDRDLAAAETDDPERFKRGNLGYIDDVAESLDWSRHASYRPDDDPYGPSETIVNPHRNVGRNDPCPCGSGKKFKKCCLATA